MLRLARSALGAAVLSGAQRLQQHVQAHPNTGVVLWSQCILGALMAFFGAGALRAAWSNNPLGWLLGAFIGFLAIGYMISSLMRVRYELGQIRGYSWVTDQVVHYYQLAFGVWALSWMFLVLDDVPVTWGFQSTENLLHFGSRWVIPGSVILLLVFYQYEQCPRPAPTISATRTVLGSGPISTVRLLADWRITADHYTAFKRIAASMLALSAAWWCVLVLTNLTLESAPLVVTGLCFGFVWVVVWRRLRDAEGVAAAYMRAEHYSGTEEEYGLPRQLASTTLRQIADEYQAPHRVWLWLGAMGLSLVRVATLLLLGLTAYYRLTGEFSFTNIETQALIGCMGILLAIYVAFGVRIVTGFRRLERNYSQLQLTSGPSALALPAAPTLADELQRYINNPNNE